MDEEIAAARRARKAEWQRNRRAGFVRTEVCGYCGGRPLKGRTRCGACVEAGRRGEADRRTARKVRKLAEARAAAPRACPGCTGADLRKMGFKSGRQRYLCKTCGRSSYGDGPAAPLPAWPCPYCAKQCVKHGKSKNKGHAQMYLCRGCGRVNTKLWPADTPSPGGPFPHQKVFCLNTAANRRLMEYCNAHGMSVSQAIRAIFCTAAHDPVVKVATSQAVRSWDGRVVGSIKTTRRWVDEVATLPPGGVRLPDLRPESARKFLSSSGEARYRPTVLVVFCASVLLNDMALAGLLRAMRARNLNHQDAARALISEARW